jgi:hypothetical protein
MGLIVGMNELFEPIGEALVVNGICDLKSNIPLEFYTSLVMFYIIIVLTVILLSLSSK